MKTRTFIIRAGLARMLCMGFVLASVTLAASIGAASASSPGELDQSFGVGGTVVTSMGGGMAQVTAVAILKGHEGHQDHHGAKGKANKDVKKFEILAGGPALLSPGGLNRGFALARYNDDGTLDTTWGAGGKVLTTVGSGDAFAWAMAIQHDRKIVQAGYAYTPSGLPPPAPPAFKRFALVRYNEDGSLDSTFGSGGIVLTPVGPGSAVARAVTIQGHRIIVGGYSSRCVCDPVGQSSSFPGSLDTVAMARYEEDGSLDASFGRGGIATPLASVTTLTRSNAEVVVQEDGKIVTGGIIASEGPSKVLTVRLNDDGSLDDSFNGTGYAATLVRGSDVALTTALQADDKIVQAGFTSGATPGRTDLILTRLNADGTPDTGFGVDGNGTVVTALTTGLSAARAVTVNDDGKIIVVGRAHVAGGATDLDFLVERYNTDGTLDSSFGVGGITTTNLGLVDQGQAVALEHGRILTGGVSNDQFALVRYMDD